jgi:hypothetical protein
VRRAVKRVELEVCSDCYAIITGFDVTQYCDNDVNALDRSARQLEADWPEPWELHAGGWDECEACQDNDRGCESYFSWRACESCHASLGGDRYHAVAIRWLTPAEELLDSVGELP